jgi:phage gpG-like protein
MADAITIHLNDTAVLARLSEISRRLDNMKPVMGAIGEVVMESTKVRFATSTGPDGQRWAPNAPGTVLARLAEISGNFARYSNLKTRKEGQVRVGNKRGYFDKQGRITQKSATILANKKPLVATGELRDSIRWKVVDGGNGVEIGTNRFAGEWDAGAAVHQFGSKDGTIPARPFLGVSASDETAVLDILDGFLRSTLDRP